MGRGPKFTLTRLEAEVMAAVWDKDPAPVCVRDVLDAVNAGRDESLAYNTIQTILNILKDKGVVKLAPAKGRALYYRAAVSRKKVSKNMVADLVERLFRGRFQPLLQQLIDDAPLDRNELKQLRRWVEAKLKDAKEGDDD